MYSYVCVHVMNGQTEVTGEFEAKLNLFGECLAIQRVRRLVHCVNITNLLTFLLGQSFRKVYMPVYGIFVNSFMPNCLCP